MATANPQGGITTDARVRDANKRLQTGATHERELESRSDERTKLDDPVGLKVPLWTHQRQALAWLAGRERQEPAGGILADEKSLGSTLTFISLILKQKEIREHGTEEEKIPWLNRDKQLEKLGTSVVKSNATLIVCPASVIHQWSEEVDQRCRARLLKVFTYDGVNRDSNKLSSADNDIVLTTYDIISSEVDKDAEEAKKVRQPNILRIAWERVILDEAHIIKNFKSKKAKSVCELIAGFRWALTSTPIQNSLHDMYSLLRFLRCTPFDEYQVWKKIVTEDLDLTAKRLNIIVRPLLLRRTKEQTDNTGKLLILLPHKSPDVIEIILTDKERRVYNQLLAKTKKTLGNFVKRYEEKQTSEKKKGGATGMGGASGDDGQKASGSDILVLILRLRQSCCHLGLMKEQMEDESLECEGVVKDEVELMLEVILDSEKSTPTERQGMMTKLSAMLDSYSSKLEDESLESEGLVKDEIELTEEQIQGLMLELDKSTLTDSTEHIHSSKLKAVMEKIICITNEGVKSVIVSQWTNMLDIIAYHLGKMGIRHSTIRGNVNPKKRMELVEEFNNNPRGSQVMLVSLTTGGVGLNLIGGSHLFILDIHWNPALEDQVCDRIYRKGQERNVFIHKFVCKDTIEENIIKLQERKRQLADNVLSGTGGANQK